MDDIAQGDVSGLNDINLNVSTVGANVASFNYKVVGDSNDCAVSSGYTNSVDMNPVALSVAAMSDGEVHICAVPVLTNGYIRPLSLANIFSYERDTECGNVNGDGQTKPYEIRTEEDLAAINNAAKCLQASYKLMNDISLTSLNWTPIGQRTVEFKGTFDGQSKLISDLLIDNDTLKDVGLFGVTSGATIENLRVEGPLVHGLEQVGGLVGYANGGTVIRNCEVHVHVRTPPHKYNAGGLVGWLHNSSEISDSSSKGSVAGGHKIGGLIGRADNVSIYSSSSSAQVFSITDNLGSGGIGGLIGFLIGGTIEKSFSTGNVSSPAKSAGGFIGGIEKGNIRKSFSTGNVSAGSIVGGFAGYLVERDGSGQALIEDCYSIGNVTGGGDDYKNGGFIGALEGGKVKNSYSYSYFLNPIDKA